MRGPPRPQCDLAHAVRAAVMCDLDGVDAAGQRVERSGLRGPLGVPEQKDPGARARHEQDDACVVAFEAGRFEGRPHDPHAPLADAPRLAGPNALSCTLALRPRTREAQPTSGVQGLQTACVVAVIVGDQESADPRDAEPRHRSPHGHRVGTAIDEQGARAVPHQDGVTLPDVENDHCRRAGHGRGERHRQQRARDRRPRSHTSDPPRSGPPGPDHRAPPDPSHHSDEGGRTDRHRYARQAGETAHEVQ